MNLDRQTALLKALGRIEGFKNDLHRLSSELGGAPLWLPGRRLEKQCGQAIGMIDGIAERFDRKLVVTLVGPCGSGKSTLLNALTRSKVHVEDRLFATLDPSSRRLKFPQDLEVIITDTVGFIHNLPKELMAAFRATLEELENADLLLHVIDISNPQHVELRPLSCHPGDSQDQSSQPIRNDEEGPQSRDHPESG